MRIVGYVRTGTLAVMSLAGFLACGGVAKADYAYGEPAKVPNINSGLMDARPQISRDGLELYFTSRREHGDAECYSKIWVSRRSTTQDPWSTPTKLDPPVNGPGPGINSSISGDGLELYFADGWKEMDGWQGCLPNPGGQGLSDLWVSRRAGKDKPWGVPGNLGPVVNSANEDDTPCISADGLELYFMSNRPGGDSNPTGSDIFVATRPAKDAPWTEPVSLGPNVNSSQYEYTPFISPEGLSLFFSRGYSKAHVWVSRRKTTRDPWGPAEFFSPVNSGTGLWQGTSGGAEFNLSYSNKDSTLYFARASSLWDADFSIWQVQVVPTVDFNGDGKVDVKDVQIMAEHWGQNYPRCDIGPFAWGDGIVDAQDLAVLAQYMIGHVSDGK